MECFNFAAKPLRKGLRRLPLTFLAVIRGFLRMFLRRVFTLAPDARAPHQGYVVVGGAATTPHLTGQGDGSLLGDSLKVCLVLLVPVEGEQFEHLNLPVPQKYFLDHSYILQTAHFWANTGVV